VLQETLRNIIRNTLPFVLNVEGYPSNISEFNDIITQMREDREFVFHTPVRLEQRYEGDEHPKAVDVRLETIFAKRLLDRLSNVIGEASARQAARGLCHYLFIHFSSILLLKQSPIINDFNILATSLVIIG
jgi:recombinational DNA repair protein (RecF pathway)